MTTAHFLYAASMETGKIFAAAQGWEQVGNRVFKRPDGALVLVAVRAYAMRGRIVGTVYLAPGYYACPDWSSIDEVVGDRANNIILLEEI